MTPESEHRELDDVTWTTAVLLIGFVVTSAILLYLANNKDENLRKSTWLLISTTMTIFCAASFDFAIDKSFTLILEIYGAEKYKEVVVFLYACFVFAALHGFIFLWVSKDDYRTLFAGGTLGSHLFAFACILFFSELQVKHFQKDIFLASLVPLAAILILGSLFFVIKCLGSDGTRHQKHQAQEAHCEASAICVGFLLVQVICYGMSLDKDEEAFMPTIIGDPGKHREHTPEILWTIAGVLFFLSLVWQCAKGRFRKCRIFFEFVGLLASCTVCWCLQRGSVLKFYHFCKWRMEWYLKRQFCHDVGCRKHVVLNPEQVMKRATILNAFGMSALAITLTFLIAKGTRKSLGFLSVRMAKRQRSWICMMLQQLCALC